MSYRKINVDGIQYQYVVGKTHTKIRGFKTVFENSKIGDKQYMACECCGEPFDAIYDMSKKTESEKDYYRTIRVTPKNISNVIKGLV